MQFRLALRWFLPGALCAGLGCLTPSAGVPSGQGGAGGANPSPPARPSRPESPGSGGSGAAGSGGGAGIPEGKPPAPDAGGTSADGATSSSAGDAADGRVPVGPPPPPPPSFRAPGLVMYWGQNSYSRLTTDRMLHETDLATTCRQNPHYEVMVIGFVNRFVVPQAAVGEIGTPLVNFSRHCNNKYALAQCDEIGRGVNECQRLGKKVLISLGGATGSYGFRSDAEARQFAQSTWDLFLNGQSTYRPFSTAVVDGVDLDIEGGSSVGYAAYVTRLRELMNTDRSRKYYIAGAPQCPFPDAYLGPAPGRALGEAARAFDFLFVQFYNNACGAFNPDFMVQAFNQWARVGPKIIVGLPAGLGAGGGFIDRATLPGVLDRVKRNPAFGGVMLWDASYDQNSAEGGLTYGAFVKRQLP